MRRIFLAAAAILVLLAAPSTSRADAVGAAFGAGTGLVVAGPPGAVIGGVIGAVWGRPFWGPPNSPHACWIDNAFYRHCRYYAGRWHYY
jgi:osmotically inducible lipoprotein OsmB